MTRSKNTRVPNAYRYRAVIQNYKSTWTSGNYHTFIHSNQFDYVIKDMLPLYNFFLKVIFLKSNSFRFIEILYISMELWEGGRNPPWYRKCWPKLFLIKQTFYLYFFSFLWHEILVLIFNICEGWTFKNTRGLISTHFLTFLIDL
jgi:hypothetical protein